MEYRTLGRGLTVSGTGFGAMSFSEFYGDADDSRSLAWLLAQDRTIVPIPGTKRIAYLEENAAAADIRLEEEDRHYLNEAGRYFSVQGARYTEEGMKGVNA